MTVIVVTAGIYGLSGFEITPSAIIGFLTIMSYCSMTRWWSSTRSGKTR